MGLELEVHPWLLRAWLLWREAVRWPWEAFVVFSWWSEVLVVWTVMEVFVLYFRIVDIDQDKNMDDYW